MSDMDELLASLHDHLQATEELPLDETANRWLGEAQAVAADVADGNVSEEVAKERVEKVVDLLEEVETTGHEEGDQHVAAASRAADRILDQ